MVRVVQAPCPGCKHVLRMPLEWVGQPMRCKHCGLILQGKPRPAADPMPQPADATAPAAAFSDTLPIAAPVAPVFNGSPFEDLGSPLSTHGAALRARRAKRGSGWKKLVAVTVGLAAVIGPLAYFFGQELRDRFLGGQGENSSAAPGDARPNGNASATTRPIGDTGKPSLPKDLPADGPFPRRALVVGVSNYLYANPISYLLKGEEEGTFAPMDRIAATLRIHPDQVVELSDAALGVKAVPPLKLVIEQTVQEFLDTCRAQDRILVLFIGHAVEIDDTPYLVPLEGELAFKETLIPLSWLYEQLAKCKARQKVLLLDVCRYDPGRGFERPGSPPMGEKFDAALQNPPEGVQVWSACTKGQVSHEFASGGLFLKNFVDALKPVLSKRLQRPNEPLPIDALLQTVQDNTEGRVAKQTPRLTGKEAESGAAYNPDEKLPAKLTAKLPVPAGAGLASRAEVNDLMQEIDLPSVKPPRADTKPLRLEMLVPFTVEALEPYKADYKSLAEIKAQPGKFPLRVAVLEASGMLHKHAQAPLTERWTGVSSDAIKSSILKEQRGPADVILELSEAVEKLRDLADKRAEETKRWQAHYDYVLSQLLARIAYVHEYNLMLGKIRKDELPQLEKFHSGYQLSSREKLQSDKATRDLAAESKKLLAQIIKRHPGTPWEVLARRERLTTLGLEWQPTR